jgi:hypothetical protein
MNSGQEVMVSTLQCKAFCASVPLIPYLAPSPVRSHVFSPLRVDCRNGGFINLRKL